MNHSDISQNITVTTVSESEQKGSFSVSGLYPGYGLTVGNALRRALLSSLPGSAITYIKVKNTDHEFSTIPGVAEDMVELIINLKKVRFQSFSNETQTASIKVKGANEVTAADIKTSSDLKVVNPEQFIASLTTKSAELDVELTIEHGLGYYPADGRKETKLTVGLIAVDALFSPVTKVSFDVENIRVGDRTDYNQVNLNIETDGTISPSEAFNKSASILADHFSLISGTKTNAKNNQEEVSDTDDGDDANNKSDE